MTLIVLDKSIGFCLAEGWSEKLPKLVVRSEVDAGPAKQRRVTTAAPSVVTVAYLVTTAEREFLEDFYMGDAAGGAVWFEWWHPVKLENRLARFMADNEPIYKPMRPDWIWSAVLEVRPKW